MTGKLSRSGEYAAKNPLIAAVNPSKRMKSLIWARKEQC